MPLTNPPSPPFCLPRFSFWLEGEGERFPPSSGTPCSSDPPRRYFGEIEVYLPFLDSLFFFLIPLPRSPTLWGLFFSNGSFRQELLLLPLPPLVFPQVQEGPPTPTPSRLHRTPGYFPILCPAISPPTVLFLFLGIKVHRGVPAT